MNKERRLRLATAQVQAERIKSMLPELKADGIQDLIDKLTSLNDVVYDIQSDEQYAYNSIPENLQGSDRGMRMDDAIMEMDDAQSGLDDVIHCLEDVRKGGNIYKPAYAAERMDFVIKSIDNARSC